MGVMSDEVPSKPPAHDAPSMKSALGRVRGLGSARAGTEHWWMQRLTSLALIPLSLILMGSFFNAAVFGNGYADTVAWLHRPWGAGTVLLFLAVGFHHAASGTQVVIEDYVHCECMKLASVITVKFAAAAFAVIGILAAGKIFFGV
jgi:succinate dehydrogenase / fumarate reductase membrane anchor subunit